MALDKPTLIEDLISIFENPQTETNIETVAQELANAIEKYVKSGLVTGTCPPSGGPLTQGKVT